MGIQSSYQDSDRDKGVVAFKYPLISFLVGTGTGLRT